MSDIINKTKDRFLEMIKNDNEDRYHLVSHIEELERWANFMCDSYPEADKEVVMLSVYLHDIGHYPINLDTDHAVVGEKRAREFLTKQKYPDDKMKKVLHCVRAHRCKDVLPETLEAKIMAFIDSASHITDGMYISVSKHYKRGLTTTNPLDKLERDLRDLNTFPEIKEKLIGLYEAWKRVVIEYDRIDFLK
jgi:hypothetical protein